MGIYFCRPARQKPSGLVLQLCTRHPPLRHASTLPPSPPPPAVHLGHDFQLWTRDQPLFRDMPPPLPPLPPSAAYLGHDLQLCAEFRAADGRCRRRRGRSVCIWGSCTVIDF